MEAVRESGVNCGHQMIHRSPGRSLPQCSCHIQSLEAACGNHVMNMKVMMDVPGKPLVNYSTVFSGLRDRCIPGAATVLRKSVPPRTW